MVPAASPSSEMSRRLRGRTWLGVVMDHPSKLSRRCDTHAPPVVAHCRCRKARQGMAVLGNLEKVDEVAGSIRKAAEGNFGSDESER